MTFSKQIDVAQICLEMCDLLAISTSMRISLLILSFDSHTFVLHVFETFTDSANSVFFFFFFFFSVMSA